MPHVARHQGELVDDGDGGDFEIGQCEWHSRFFETSAKRAADIGGLAVKAHDIDGWKQYFLEIFKVIVRAFAFPCSVHDLGHGGGRDLGF